MDHFSDLTSESRQYLNSVPDIIFTLSFSGNILFINKEIENRLQYTEKEIVGTHFMYIVHPEDLLRIKDTFSKIVAGEETKIQEISLRLLSKDGNSHWFELNLNSVRNKQENEFFIIGIAHQNDKLHIIQQELIEKNDQLEKIYQNLHSSYLALGKINAQISSLSEMNTAFISAMSWEDKIFHILKSIKSFTSANAVILRILDKKKKHFIIKHIIGINEKWKNKPLKEDLKLLEDIRRKKNPIKMFHLDTDIYDCSMTEIAKEVNSTSILVTPVIINEEVIGILAIFFGNQKSLEEINPQLSMTYTSHLAITLMMSGDCDHIIPNIF